VRLAARAINHERVFQRLNLVIAGTVFAEGDLDVLVHKININSVFGEDKEILLKTMA